MLVINALSCFHSAQASGARNGAANIQGGPSHLSWSSLDSPSQTWPEIGFHEDSKAHHVDGQG